MPSYSKYNIVYRLQKWMDSVAGQTFMNYAYSWGASVVILGTLFKLTHLPGANLMLFIGMGTEVFVFFISAFDRPFDKTQDGMELPTSRNKVAVEAEEEDETVAAPEPIITPTGNIQGGTVIVNGVIGGSNGPTTPAPAVSQETAEAMEEATTTYVDRLKDLNELLLKVAAQSERLTTDSIEMENLNRTLTGIAKVYEMQLKGASQQIGTIDEINAKTRKMAEQIESLNKVYARMIEAMTVNMPGVGGTASNPTV
jgi:gliding motility-associated protein GldL